MSHTPRQLEMCSVCNEPTGHAGAGEDSIFRCDGQIGPLCNECNATLDKEAAEDNGWESFADLLEACKECLEVVDDCYEATGHVKVAVGSDQRTKIEAAIAKAEGNQS